MARKRTGRTKTSVGRASPSSGGRGSVEAIEKRRAARQLNSLLSGGVKSGRRLDGRTEKRRQRLLKELKDGRSGRTLKPIDFVAHVDELLQLGETVGSIRKSGIKPRKIEANEEITSVVRRTQTAYGFRPEAWRMLGVDVGGEEQSSGSRLKRGRTATKRRRTA